MGDTVIHIGLPKTGTTFIQDQVLSESKNIFYIGRPYTQEGTAFNMIQYCDDTLYDEAVVQNEINSLRCRADGRKMVISDEILAGSPQYGFRNRSSVARRLQKCFPEARIVLTLRNQIDLLASLFRQWTKTQGYENVLDERFVHETGDGLSFEEWKNGKGWNMSNRYVSHDFLMSAKYFRYTDLFDLYSNLFGEVKVLLFEDFVEGKDCYFKGWGEVAEVEASKIRERAGRDINPRTGHHDENILRNRALSLLDDVNMIGKNAIMKIIQVGLKPFLGEVVQKDQIMDLVLKEGIPEDNYELLGRGVDGVGRHSEKYLINKR